MRLPRDHRAQRLVWTDRDTGVTTTSPFSDLGDARTEIQIRQTNVPEAFRSPEAQAGFKTSLDRFATYLVAVSRHRLHDHVICDANHAIIELANQVPKTQSK